MLMTCNVLTETSAIERVFCLFVKTCHQVKNSVALELTYSTSFIWSVETQSAEFLAHVGNILGLPFVSFSFAFHFITRQINPLADILSTNLYCLAGTFVKKRSLSILLICSNFNDYFAAFFWFTKCYFIFYFMMSQLPYSGSVHHAKTTLF